MYFQVSGVQWLGEIPLWHGVQVVVSSSLAGPTSLLLARQDLRCS